MALVASATSSDLRRARALLDADPTVALHDLASACVAGEPDEVSRRLAARPAAVGEPTGPHAWEPILYACFSRLLRGDPHRAPGIREVVRRLLAAGANPNAAFINADNWIQVALYGAAGIAGDPELTRMLLEAGADPTDDREGYQGNEVLYHACEFADPTCAMLVIDAGARQDLVDYDLGRALNFPNPEMVEMFCTHGARASADHLHQAVWRRRPPRTIAALLDAGAPTDAPDEQGLTPLRIAVRWGDDDVAATLRDRGADDAAVTDDDLAIGRLPVRPRRRRARPGGRLIGARRDADDCGPGRPPAGNAPAARRRRPTSTATLTAREPRSARPAGAAACRSSRELVDRGAALRFHNGGSAIGAALHGSRNCHQPEGGPTMMTVDEIPTQPYAAIVRFLLDRGATVPERIGESGPRATTLLAELGIDPPA